MAEFREKYHRSMFLTARILSMLLALAWLGLLLYALYQLNSLSKTMGMTFSIIMQQMIKPLIIVSVICLVHMLIAIYIQQRKKWAVASLFVLATFEFGLTGFYYFVAYKTEAPAIAYVILTTIIMALGILIWSLTESYKAINHEKTLSQAGFMPVMKDAPAPLNALPVETLEDK